MYSATTKRRAVVAWAFLFITLGTLAGCGDVITSPQNNDGDNCVLIDGVLHCK